MESISVVVPIYNSITTLNPLVNRLHEVLEKLDSPFEVILVDDGSVDGSWRAVEELSTHNKHVLGLQMTRNYGQHNALLAGIREATHRLIVTLDDDLQNPPEEIPHLLESLTDDLDVVYGTPQNEQHGLLRGLASKLTKLTLQKTMGASTASKVSAFRAFRTEIRESFADYSGSFVSIDVLLTWGTDRFHSIPVQQSSRLAGQSGYTLTKLLTHTLNMVTGFSTWPLRLAGFIGFMFSLLGAGILAYVLWRFFAEGDLVPGFPFLASMIALFSGAQLFALGVIGEYLSRVHFRTMDKPAYRVRKRTQ